MEQIQVKPTLGFSEAITTALNRFLDIEGRSRRSEYWWSMLVIIIAGLIIKPVIGKFFYNLFLLGMRTPLSIRRLHDIGRSGWWWGVYLIYYIGSIIYVLFMLNNATGHLTLYSIIEIYQATDDFEYTGWVAAELFYNFILFIFFCLDSEKDRNKYGESPKYVVIKPTLNNNMG